MSDSRYLIVNEKYIVPKTEKIPEGEYDLLPTYTLPEILYKLPEYASGYGSLGFWKDAPFYCFGFDKKGYVVDSEYPIESAALLLLKCSRNKDLWYVGDISGK